MKKDMSEKNVLVIGLARSGMAAIKLLHKLGASVTVSERKKPEDLKELPLLQEMGVRVIGQELGDLEGNY